ncbi:MAG: hypothetical protein KAH56_11885 [Candidatus Krumholzibacteria bacterium]|nr:hypothetical protein [Candidatus Krumholzibacteria bacterium]
MNKIASAHTGNSSLIATLCLPVLLAFALLALILFVGACSEDTTEVPFPPQPLPETQNWLFTVYGNSPDDVYVGGAKGALMHYDGNLQNKWTLIPVGTSKAITSIWPSGDGTLYATGHGGAILRGSGSSWSTMASGTSKNLFSIGRFEGKIYACGVEGTLLRLNGNTWGGAPGLSWILDETGAPSDTLIFGQDVASLTTVNSFFFGGAFNDPNFTGKPDGTLGTKGGVFEIADHTSFPPPESDTGAYKVLPDWILRPLSGEQIVDDEWILCSTSDPASLSRNYLGTSEGWLFQLSDARGDTVWTKFTPSVTVNPRGGIQDIWLDEHQNIYMVTDEGSIVYQTADYVFNESGSRETLYDGPVSLTGIWGTGQGTFFVVGYMEDMLMRCTHNPSSGYFNFVFVSVKFPAGKAMNPGPTVDKFGRPLY